VLAANPGRVQALIDLMPMKDDNGFCRRESPEVQETATHLRQLLRDGGA
jgi:NitT/TauT family transport system ATP-binding protein